MMKRFYGSDSNKGRLRKCIISLIDTSLTVSLERSQSTFYIEMAEQVNKNRERNWHKHLLMELFLNILDNNN